MKTKTPMEIFWELLIRATFSLMISGACGVLVGMYLNNLGMGVVAFLVMCRLGGSNDDKQ